MHKTSRRRSAAMRQMLRQSAHRNRLDNAFRTRFLPLVNESPSKDAFFALFHRLPIGGAQQLPYISRCRLGRQTQHHLRIRNT
ncbi:hypothetical protein XHV734_2999 [Xanthomonas hortorum pv. vitians]|nr:hypothetical protein XHV734_2999 [Xanthomonas hortorum pv. vitians]